MTWSAVSPARLRRGGFGIAAGVHSMISMIPFNHESKNEPTASPHARCVVPTCVVPRKQVASWVSAVFCCCRSGTDAELRLCNNQCNETFDRCVNLRNDVSQFTPPLGARDLR